MGPGILPPPRYFEPQVKKAPVPKDEGSSTSSTAIDSKVPRSTGTLTLPTAEGQAGAFLDQGGASGLALAPGGQRKPKAAPAGPRGG